LAIANLPIFLDFQADVLFHLLFSLDAACCDGRPSSTRSPDTAR
jgi:hypothetical protein